jgi:hypothetical protein
MDIWDWVGRATVELRNQGNERLADAMEQIPSLAVGDHHAKLDQIYPEALGLAKKESNPWIEVFVRHWYLQSQILHRHNVTGMLDEAIDLLEFSSRENTKDCPQSVCAVQDLANCYAKKDGPAFVEERIAVSTETLSKINPAWPCYECIAAEELDAHIDAKDFNQALLRIGYYRDELAKASANTDKIPFGLTESEIYVRLGKFEQAEKIAKASENPKGGESFLRYRSASIALSLAYQNKFDEAEEYELHFSDALLAQSHYSDWCEYNYLKAKQDPKTNTNDLNYCFNRMINNYRSHGVLRDSIKTLHWQAELAILRGDLFTLEQAILAIEELIGELSKDLGATQILEKLRTTLSLETVKLDNDLLSNPQLIEGKALHNENTSLTILKLLYQRDETELQTVIAYFDALVENGYSHLALPIAELFISNNTDCHSLVSRYGHLLLSDGLQDQFDQYFSDSFIDSLPDEGKNNAFWLLSRRFETQDIKKSYQYLELILDRDPKAENTIEKAANLSLKLNNYKRSIELWSQLINLDLEQNSHFHWDRMIAATLAGDWQSVRESCGVLDIELADEVGAVQLDMGACRIEYTDSYGEKINLAARRTGPVEAEITTIRELNQEQFYGNRVVFEAIPLNQLDQEDEEGYVCDSEGFYTSLYPKVKTLETNPHFYFSIDGVHPGEENWQLIEAVFADLELSWSIRSSEEYQVKQNDQEPALNAIYVFVACPENTDLNAVHQQLQAVMEKFEHPLIWPLLLIELKAEGELEIQSAVEEEYALY